MKSVTEIVTSILKLKNKPIHYTDLCKEILKSKNFVTATPVESIRTMISLSAKFDSYGKGLYGLQEWGFKWYKEFYNNGFYFALSDIVFELLQERKTSSIKEMIFLVEDKYPKRYRSLSITLPEAVRNDKRFGINKDIISIPKVNKEIFSPNNIDSILEDAKKLIDNNARPIFYKDILKKIEIIKIKEINSKQILFLWLSIDRRFIKLGPRGYYGLRKWIS